MASMAEEAIGGFNGFLKEQQKEEGEARLSLILFDHDSRAKVAQMIQHQQDKYG